MAAFSVNQVKQLYVAKEYKSSLATTDNAGSMSVKSDTAKTHLYIDYIGAGGRTRSDLIPIKDIVSVSAVDANSLKHSLKRYKIVLDSTVNSGNPVAGQDYLLRILLSPYIGISPEDQGFKYGTVHAISSMTASDFYKNMIISLVKNFSREVVKFFNFYLETGGSAPGTEGTAVPVDETTDLSTLSGTYTGMIIEEAEQPWTLGVFEQTAVTFNLMPGCITYNGDELIWGEVNAVTPKNSVINGKKTADLEYFCMGERGDVYRMMGFPHVIHTKYLVDPTVAYNMINIHYVYQGDGEDIQKSEKDIIIAVPKVGATNSVSNVLANTIISAINTATGLTIPTLDVSGN